ncbi:hypothetical protein PHSY_001584 [Pseudozyma hubeiensis SY62]|uniref:Uncharacterized protein n=1 Tax=Pseudozyma hubeiensis (strain SY62) TaxID=1305764 RepID=R9P7D8_PSEHS|nr:hypothetical protein PHSY_001584 [Pseudozyma hubeiensis SY62]GAC94015.1 hypothetical protein PHSY_001584 [Pseudozyma hubeiensis SY62]
MWFQRVSLLALSVLLLSVAVRANPPTAAVAFVDVKLDDKAAVWSLLLDQRYSKVIAITTGINEHRRAAYELDQYVDRQNAMANVKFNKDKLEILQGSNPLPSSAPHEAWWGGQPGLRVAAADESTLRRRLHGYRVSVLQIAPTAPGQVQAVLDAADRGSIVSYMLLHGYNSRQASMRDQTSFLRNLRSWVKANNPNAEVYFTSSMDTYAAKNGGKQPYTAIQHMFPRQDLDQAMRDPFWSSQLLKAHKQEGLDIPEFPIQDQQQLDDIILQARTHPNHPNSAAWRNYITQYINTALANNPGRDTDNLVLTRLRHTHLPEFSGDATLELADAAHIAAFHRFQDGGSNMHAEPVRFAAGPHAEGAKVDFSPATGNELHGYLVRGADRDEDLAYIKQLAGVWH